MVLRGWRTGRTFSWNESLSEDRVDSLIADVLFVVESADVSGYERLDAVAEASCC